MVDSTQQLFSVSEFDRRGNLIFDEAFPFDAPIAHFDEDETIAMQKALDLHEASEAFLVGGDNTSASLAVWKGYSRSEMINRHLRVFPGRLIIVDVPGSENFADSRRDGARRTRRRK